ncbi:MAG: hypothetical protein WDM79_00530 [Terricaulis sp.]
MRLRTGIAAFCLVLIAPNALAQEAPICAHALAAPTVADARRIAETVLGPMHRPPAPNPWPIYVEDRGDRWHVFEGERHAAKGETPAQVGTGLWIAKCIGDVSQITTIVNVPPG